MKKNNLLRISWVVGIYAVLVLILYLVVTYKVKWEDRDLNTYLYFYNCSGDLCTSEIQPDDYYGKVVCKNDICPYIKEKSDDYLILSDNSSEFLYNYKNDKIISKKYSTYKLSSDNNYIVINKNNKYGVIDSDNKLIFELTDKKITDFKNGFITYKENGKYGIINTEKDINIKPNYEEVILIDSNIYGYLEKEKYYIASYDTEVPITGNSYDYLVPINSIILTFNNKQLDILDNSLKSKLLMKVDCAYEYRVEKERKTLDIKVLDNLVSFSIYIGDNQYTNYYFDLKNNKLFS